MVLSRCFLPARECKFVMDIVDAIDSLLNCNLNIYGGIVYSLVYKNTAVNENKATVTLEGYVAFVYYMRYNEPYPANPTRIQKELINLIWDALGHPEKKFPI